MKQKLWINLFIRIAVIFAVFLTLIFLANSTLLVSYFSLKQEGVLATNSQKIAKIDPKNTAALESAIWELKENQSFDIEIYDAEGKIVYTTHGPDIQFPGSDKFGALHERFEIITSKTLKDGSLILTARSDITNEKYLICRRMQGEFTTELRTKLSLLENSAYIAGEFITIIAIICFAASLIWVFLFAKKFSAPITEMSKITENMANLDFSQKVTVERKDEIGKLGVSINNLSDKLDASLMELRASNAKLRDEIELERSLDVMRKAFVANVSHELKTPLSIISGYAEGLKLNVNNASKDEYCDTIIDETQRMNRLVLSILKLSKYESSQMPREPELFDISVLAAEMEKRISEDMKDVAFSCDIPYGSVVFADLSETEQILKSFLENAVAHVSQDGKIRIFSSETEDRMMVSVYNSGEKIDPEIMPQIWQSFFRGDTAHSRNEGRFGLGLSIVSAIVKATGERCGVYNTEDGVCFWFTLKKAK